MLTADVHAMSLLQVLQKVDRDSPQNHMMTEMSQQNHQIKNYQGRNAVQRQ